MKVISFALTLVTLSMFFSCQTQKYKDKDIVKVSYIHRYGVPIEQHDWDNLGKTGEVETLYKSGVKVSQSFLDGMLDGRVTYTYPHTDTLQKEERYQKGQLLSSQKNYPNGSPHKQVEFLKEGKKEKIWYESGSPKSIEVFRDGLLFDGQYFNDKHEIDARVHAYNGSRIIRDNFGKILTLDNVVEGKMALQTTFYPNQDPKAITPFQNDLIHGERKTFLAGGVPHTIEQWEHGKQQGITVSFLNGEKSSSVVYVKGKKHGEELRFSNNGDKIVEQIHWSNGLKHGPMRSFITDNQVQVEHYFRGRVVSKIMFDDLQEKVH